jgi:hypothetical protein
MSRDQAFAINPTVQRPIVTELSGVDVRAFVFPDSLTIQETIGQSAMGSLMFVNPSFTPIPGMKVRILFHSLVIFSGTIDRVHKTTEGLAATKYTCDLLDYAQVLTRRKIQRNFTNTSVQAILQSILSNELSTEGFTIGTVDTRVTVPLVDAANNARVLDILRDLANATGCVLLIGFDKSINMISTSTDDAPLILNESNSLLEGTEVSIDRESYRNVQTVVVTGTVPSGASSSALSVSVIRLNQNEIDDRIAIEGGSGRYEEIEEIIHPTSNDPGQMALLGIGYANLRLATSSTQRQTFSVQVRGYGFRAGQTAIVDLPTYGISGTFIVQRVSIQERFGTELFHTLELTSTSRQRRSFESWLNVVKSGKVTVQVPAITVTNAQVFNTAGTTTWTVPVGVTVAQFTTLGGSGGGGGSSLGINFPLPDWVYGKDGGKGGNSGKAISIINVQAGEVYDLVIGAGGAAGANGIPVIGSNNGTPGSVGAATHVKLATVLIAQGNGGGGGGGADASNPGIDGTPGGGAGDAVTVGGGKVGGAKGLNGIQPVAGSAGQITVEW